MCKEKGKSNFKGVFISSHFPVGHTRFQHRDFYWSKRRKTRDMKHRNKFF